MKGLPFRDHDQFDGSREGGQKAIKQSSDLDEMLRAYKRLNTREARVGFADAWLKTSASYFNEAWPVIYELLKLIDEEKLYADPRRLGAGDHSQTSFQSFQEYFEARLKRPFTTWFELEQTYHYVQKCAPDLIDKTWIEAQHKRAESAQEADAADHANLRLRGRPKKNAGNAEIDAPIYSGRPNKNTRAQALRRLRKGRPDIHKRVLAGELSPHAGMIEAGFRKKPVRKKLSWVERTIKTMDEKRTKPERRAVFVHLKKEFG